MRWSCRTTPPLFTRVLTADRLNLIPTDSLSAPIRAKARIRYRQQEQPCTIEQTGPDTVRVEFDQPQRAVTRARQWSFTTATW